MSRIHVASVERIIFVRSSHGEMAKGRSFLDAIPVSTADRARIAHGNAKRLFNLKMLSPAGRRGRSKLPKTGLPCDVLAIAMIICIGIMRMSMDAASEDYRGMPVICSANEYRRSMFSCGQSIVRPHERNSAAAASAADKPKLRECSTFAS